MGLTAAALSPQTEVDYGVEMAAMLLPFDLPAANQYIKDTNELREIVNRHPDGRFIIVNVREQYIRVYDNNALIIYEKVIVGKPGHATPLFTSTISSVIMAPQWSLPKRIATNYFPKIKKAGGKPGFTFYVDGNVTPISEISPSDTYRVIQSPGPSNALGAFKFNTKLGKYSIFIHGTANKGLFKREKRRFSSGCIRMENPWRLASFLLGKTPTKIKKMLKKSNNSYNRVNNEIQVYTVSWKHWFSPEGDLIHSGK